MKKFSIFILYAVIMEMALGGGGRLTAFGPISLRMILFVIAIGWSMLRFVKDHRIDRQYIWLLGAFTMTTFIALIIGIYNGASFQFWWEDVKPLLYFFMLPFFVFTITEPKVLNQTQSLLKKSSLLMAVAFFITLLVIHSKAIPFLEIYNRFIPTGEFFFRGEMTFYYKGFVFFCIGIIFFYFSDEKYKYIAIIVLGIALLLTLTRGLWLALSLTYACFLFIKGKRAIALGAVAIGVCVLLFGSASIGFLSRQLDRYQNRVVQNDLPDTNTKPVTKPRSHLLGDRAYSDEGRIAQIKEVFSEVTPVSFLMGHGFGNGTPTRPIHMEISYLEIFHKQGIIGLSFWLYLFLLLIKKFLNAQDRLPAYPYFLITLFIFFQSLTNQYINNPIGIFIILISIAALDLLKKERPDGINYPDKVVLGHITRQIK